MTYDIEIYGMQCRVSFDYEPPEPATFNYPGHGETVTPYDLLFMHPLTKTWVGCSVLLESDEVKDEIIEAIYAYREKNRGVR